MEEEQDPRQAGEEEAGEEVEQMEAEGQANSGQEGEERVEEGEEGSAMFCYCSTSRAWLMPFRVAAVTM